MPEGQAGATSLVNRAGIAAGAAVLIDSGLMFPEADGLSHLLVRKILSAALARLQHAEHAEHADEGDPPRP